MDNNDPDKNYPANNLLVDLSHTLPSFDFYCGFQIATNNNETELNSDSISSPKLVSILKYKA
jgi:hypothetical protein